MVWPENNAIFVYDKQKGYGQRVGDYDQVHYFDILTFLRIYLPAGSLRGFSKTFVRSWIFRLYDEKGFGIFDQIKKFWSGSKVPSPGF
jgi:hypothetical protein